MVFQSRVTHTVSDLFDNSDGFAALERAHFPIIIRNQEKRIAYGYLESSMFGPSASILKV